MSGPLKNYIYLFGNELHRTVFIKTIWSSIIVTVTALAICYPISFYMAKVARGARLRWLFMIAPDHPLLDQRTPAAVRLAAHLVGLRHPQQCVDLSRRYRRAHQFRAGNSAVIVGMAYAYVLFMVFPLYNAMESLDRNQVDAARDLGASWLRIHRRYRHPPCQTRHRGRAAS
jgi:spermidine/putrescine transport system permease protein